MTYSIGGVEVIHANASVNWNKVLAPSMYFGVSTTRVTAVATPGIAGVHGYGIESANSTSVRLVITPWNCDCNCGDCTNCSSCFLGDALVLMESGALKRIDLVEVGDRLVGAFGEINTVLGLDRVKLGNRPMFLINGHHFTSAEHSHIGIDRKFYVPSIEAALSEYGDKFPVIIGNGITEMLRYTGLSNKDRMVQMQPGNIVQTVNGPCLIKKMEEHWMMPDTPLYTLVMSGSHTYTANGFAVVGWPRDDDFDYDSWQQIKHLTLDDYK